MSNIKYKCIRNLIELEGGYVNDHSDSGGETNYGITKTVAIENGYTGSMVDMPYNTAFKIYENMYWNSLGLNSVYSIAGYNVTRKMFDIGVNMGVNRAAKFLQKCLNVFNNSGAYYDDVVEDGYIGGQTTRALTSYIKTRKDEGAEVLVTALTVLQGSFYIQLASTRQKDEKFIYGWIKNRVHDGWIKNK